MNSSLGIFWLELLPGTFWLDLLTEDTSDLIPHRGFPGLVPFPDWPHLYVKRPLINADLILTSTAGSLSIPRTRCPTENLMDG
jgi:hypothetical protein